MYTNFRKTTDITQSAFVANSVLSQAQMKGDHPNTALLSRIMQFAGYFPGNEEKIHNIAFEYAPLAEVVGQYIDLSTGLPRSAVAHPEIPGAVAQSDVYSCFGRSCGFGTNCFQKCSLGPSHNKDGQPLGPEGMAPVRHSNNAILQPETMVKGILRIDQSNQPVVMPDQKYRHRDNACIVLSMICKLCAIPPAPSGELADRLYALVPGLMEHVEKKFFAPAQPATQASMPPAQPQPTQPPAPVAPMMAPPPPMAASPTAPAQQMAPVPPQPMSAAPTPVQSAPAPQVQAAPPAAAPATVNGGPIGGYPKLFASSSLDEEYEIRACILACQRASVKPMSETAATNMLARHLEAKYTPKKTRTAWKQAAMQRGMVDGKSVDSPLKKEFWPKEIPVPAGYWSPQSATESSAAVAPQDGVAPPIATPQIPTNAPQPTYQFQPQAPAQAAQKVDAVAAPTVEVHAAVLAVKTPDGKFQSLSEPGAIEAAKALKESIDNMTHGDKEAKVFSLHMSGDAVQLCQGFRKISDYMASAAKVFDELSDYFSDRVVEQPDHAEPSASPAQAPETTPAGDGDMAAKTKKGRGKKAPKEKKPSAKKETGGAKGHRNHPDVHAEPSSWQPGSRGRPPKGVKKDAKGNALLPKGWRIINGKWHAPLEK